MAMIYLADGAPLPTSTQRNIFSPLEHRLVDAVNAEGVGVGYPAHLVVLAVDARNLGVTLAIDWAVLY